MCRINLTNEREESEAAHSCEMIGTIGVALSWRTRLIRCVDCLMATIVEGGDALVPMAG